MKKAKSTLNTAFVFAVFLGIIGVGIMVASTDTTTGAGFIEETTHSGFYNVGVFLLAVSALFAQYAIAGWSAKQALREYEAEKPR